MIEHIEAAQPKAVTQIPEPPVARFLFADTRMAWLWLIVRLYCGYEWLTSGIEKLFGYSISFSSFGKTSKAWVFGNPNPGSSMTGFIQGAISKAGGDHPSVQGWYASFLQSVVLPHANLFAILVSFGETAVGLGLILGALTGIAAFFGLFMNMNYLMAGTVSSNPILAMLAVFLILAWRIAGYYGLDHWLLPLFGTPWWSGERGKSKSTSTPVGRATYPPVPERDSTHDQPNPGG